MHGEIGTSSRDPDDHPAILERLDVLPFGDKAAAHCGQVRAELERAGTLYGPHDMQIGAHARSQGLIVVTNNIKGIVRMPGVRAENWL